MKVGIRYRARYDYAEPASFSPHLIRLFPRNIHNVRVIHSAFATDGTADVQYRHDLFDNEVARCFYPEKLPGLEFAVELDLELREKNPFHFLLDSHALRIPFDYQPDEGALLAPFLATPDSLALPAELMPPKSPRPTVEVLVGLNEWIFTQLAYERRDEGAAMAPADTLAAGRGACRDFAVLMAALLRRHGVAARLVSGYLWEPPDMDAKDRRADSALHAWVDAYLPGAGWVGLDPTNGVFCDHHRIPAAVGLTPEDVAPIRGYYYGHKKIPSHLTAALDIHPL